MTTHITPSPPSLLSQTGSSARIPTSASFSAPLLRSIHISHISNVFALITDAIGYTNTNISISSCDDPLDRQSQYPTSQLGAMRGPHRAEHIQCRRRRWTDLRRIQPGHQLHLCARTGSDQAHCTEKDSFLCGIARGSNAVPKYRGWKRSARKW
jgi:hypothetical protein